MKKQEHLRRNTEVQSDKSIPLEPRPASRLHQTKEIHPVSERVNVSSLN